MKKRLHHLAVAAALMLGSLTQAQSTGDVFFQTRPATPGPLEPGWLSKGNSKVIMFDATGNLIPVSLGTGLSLSGTTLSATASGGTWGSITGTLSAQTDLQTALNAKAATSSLGALATLNAVTSATITDATIGNADISASAAVALSKLEPLTADTFVFSNGLGVLTSFVGNGVMHRSPGGFSFLTISAGGAGAADDGKLAIFDASGGLSGARLILPPTDTDGGGAVVQGSNPILHSYSDGTGVDNLWLGAGAGNFTTTGSGANVGLGPLALSAVTDGYDNLGMGYVALGSVTSGYKNTAVGRAALFQLTTGHDNIALGYGAGYNLTTSSNNIDIGSLGVLGDSGVIRIGTSGTHTATYLAGTVNATLANGSVSNAMLANSSITINGSAVSLGGSATISSGLTIGTTAITSGTTGRYLYDNGGVVGERTSAQVLSDIGAQASGSYAGLTSNTFNGAQTIVLGTNSATPVTAETLQNTTAATLGVQSASPASIWQGNGWRSGNSTNHTLAYRAYTLPVQGTSADPTAEWRLGLSVDGAAYVDKLKVGPDKTTITSSDTLGGVLSLAGYYATVNFTIGGSGDLHFNTLATFPSASGTRIEEFGNSANYVGVAASASQQILNTSSGTLRLGLPAASPASMTVTGAGARVGTDTNTSVTNALNVAGPNGTGTGTGGTLDLGYVAPTTTGTAIGSFTSRIALKGGGEIIFSTKTAPSSSSDTGTAGEVRIAGGYLYYCSATNTWLRAALATW